MYASRASVRRVALPRPVQRLLHGQGEGVEVRPPEPGDDRDAEDRRHDDRPGQRQTGDEAGPETQRDDRLAERHQDDQRVPFGPVAGRDHGPPGAPQHDAQPVLDGQRGGPQPQPDADRDLDAEGVLRQQRRRDDQPRGDDHRNGQHQPPAAQGRVVAGHPAEDPDLGRADEEVAHGEHQRPRQATGPVHEGLRQGHREQERGAHGREPEQRHDALVGADDVAERREARPAPPQEREHHQALGQPARGGVARRHRGDVEEREDEDQVVEELQARGPGAGALGWMARDHRGPPTLSTPAVSQRTGFRQAGTGQRRRPVRDQAMTAGSRHCGRAARSRP